MELIGGWWQNVALGMVAGTILFVVAFPWYSRWRRRRWYNQLRPPKGTRPQVVVTYADVSYDVTDKLIRAADDEQGLAVWVVCDLPHVLLAPDQAADMRVLVRNPVPHHTRLDVATSSKAGERTARFLTGDEVREKYQLHAS